MDINLLRSFTILKQNYSLVNTEIYSSRAMKEGSCQWNSALFEYATSTKLISSTVSYVVAETLGKVAISRKRILSISHGLYHAEYKNAIVPAEYWLAVANIKGKPSTGGGTKGEKKSQDTFLPGRWKRAKRKSMVRKERGKEEREVFNRSHVESIGKPVVEGDGEAKVAPCRRREIRLQMA